MDITSPSQTSHALGQVPAGAEVEGLAAAVEMLEADPGNLSAWLRAALRLHDDPDASSADRAQARTSLDSVAAALGEAGHLPLAVLACRRLAELGPQEEQLANVRLRELAAAYGKNSTRVDPAASPRPPAPPRAMPANRGGSAEAPPPSPGEAGRASPRPASAPSTGGAVLRARAVAALRKAAAHAINVQQMTAAQNQRMREPLPPVPLFSALPPEAFVKLAQQVQALDLPAGARVFSAGDPGDALYIIARGTVRIERPAGDKSLVLARLRAGSFFGELALLAGGPRSAHAICETPVLLLRAGREGLERLSEREPQVAAVLAEHARRRLLQNVMLTSQLFVGLGEQEREALMGRFSFRRYDAGQVLIDEGQPGSELFVVLSGQVAVERRDAESTADGAEVLRPVATLGPGEVIGELSLLLERPTSAIVDALGPTTVLVLRREDFGEAMTRLPEVQRRLLELAAQRLAGQPTGSDMIVTGRLLRQDPDELLLDETDILL